MSSVVEHLHTNPNVHSLILGHELFSNFPKNVWKNCGEEMSRSVTRALDFDDTFCLMQFLHDPWGYVNAISKR